MEKIREALKGADMVFITAGLGGGTGTGGAPVIAEIAREMGALTVAVVTKPFHFEGKKRMKQAEEGLANLKMTADTLITIPNQRLLSISGKSMTLLEAFKKADEILFHAAKGISDIIVGHGIINLDFADVRTIMAETGMALMGTGMPPERTGPWRPPRRRSPALSWRISPSTGPAGFSSTSPAAPT